MEVDGVSRGRMDARGRLAPGRSARLFVALCAALCLTGMASAAAAEASTVRGTPQIRGAGSVTATGYSCTSFNQDDRVTKTDCAQKVVVDDSPFVPVVSITFTATASNSPSGNWRFVRWDGCTSASGNQCTISSPVYGAADFTPIAIFEDNVVPTVTSLTPTASALEERKFFFFFAADEGATFQCSVGIASFTACSSGESRIMPTEGPYTFNVRAFDASGNMSATRSIQVIAVDTALTGGPSGLTSSRSATFGFSTAAGIQFECRIDGGAFAACGTGTTGAKSYTGLADGSHTFQVRARNGEFFDTIPATRTWTVDATPPDTTVTQGPAEGSVTTLTTALLGFASSEPAGATFECRLDGAPFAPCPSPTSLGGLSAASHTFEVRAKDAAGNVDASPAQRTWTVVEPDADGDGYTAAIDCDDADANVNPGVPEIVNNDVDENCDGGKAHDRDGDGSLAGSDCDDDNAARTPGKPEVPGNGVDEDCDGADAAVAGGAGGGDTPPQGGGSTQGGAGTPTALKPVAFRLTLRYRLAKAFTTLRSFRVDGAPKGARVTVACKGKGCPKKARTFTIKKSRQAVPGYARKRLKPGWVLTVTVRQAGRVTAVRTIKVQRRKPLVASPTRCLPAGAKKPQAC